MCWLVVIWLVCCSFVGVGGWLFVIAVIGCWFVCFVGGLLLIDVCGFCMLVDLFGCGFGGCLRAASCLGFGYLRVLLI